MASRKAINYDEILRLYTVEELSSRMISNRLGYTRNTIDKHLKNCGVMRTKQEATAIAEKHKRQVHKYQPGLHSDEAKKKSRLTRYPNGPAEYCIHKGYRVLTVGENVNREEHIVIMEKHLGRKLAKNEVVHHINKIKTDNQIENLQVMQRGAHTRLHKFQLNNIPKEALIEILEGHSKIVQISRKFNIERHRIYRMRKNKENYIQLLTDRL